jgi:Fur family transcriptional regulator, ferric uptake regulator
MTALQTKKNSRSTKQRQVILEEIRNTFSHPTADEVYELVRSRLPRISLGTVYRNLESLAAQGLIQKLDSGGTQRRFDGNPGPHYHIRCMGCGKVDDIPGEADQNLDHVIRTRSDYEIWGHQLEFRGLCPQCQQGDNQSRDIRASTENSGTDVYGTVQDLGATIA